jgi:hypothetical protein
MRGGIIRAQIGFGFDDATADAPVRHGGDELTPEEGPRYLNR